MARPPVAPRRLAGDATSYDLLADAVPWQQLVVRMYEREVRTPRLAVGVTGSDLDPQATAGRRALPRLRV